MVVGDGGVGEAGAGSRAGIPADGEQDLVPAGGAKREGFVDDFDAGCRGVGRVQSDGMQCVGRHVLCMGSKGTECFHDQWLTVTTRPMAATVMSMTVSH